jgi:predicted GNAT family acetyltransferase
MKLYNNEDEKRYELKIDSDIAMIEYIKARNEIYLTHTEVPKELEGRGFGSKLVLYALEDIKEKGLRLVPLCPFVAAYIKKHPEWRELVMKGINIK